MSYRRGSIFDIQRRRSGAVALPDKILHGHMNVFVEGGRQLRNREMVGKSDPFVKIKFGLTAAQRTEVVFDSDNPVFKESMLSFPVFEPDPVGTTLEVMVFDKGLVVDELIGYTSMSYETLLKPEGMWVPIMTGRGEKTGEVKIALSYCPSPPTSASGDSQKEALSESVAAGGAGEEVSPSEVSSGSGSSVVIDAAGLRETREPESERQKQVASTAAIEERGSWSSSIPSINSSRRSSTLVASAQNEPPTAANEMAAIAAMAVRAHDAGDDNDMGGAEAHPHAAQRALGGRQEARQPEARRQSQPLVRRGSDEDDEEGELRLDAADATREAEASQKNRGRRSSIERATHKGHRRGSCGSEPPPLKHVTNGTPAARSLPFVVDFRVQSEYLFSPEARRVAQRVLSVLGCLAAVAALVLLAEEGTSRLSPGFPNSRSGEGFYLVDQTDGLCLMGNRFVSCGAKSVWSIQEEDPAGGGSRSTSALRLGGKCLAASSSEAQGHAGLSKCSVPSAAGWRLRRGRLTHALSNGSGTACVHRKGKGIVMVDCRGDEDSLELEAVTV